MNTRIKELVHQLGAFYVTYIVCMAVFAGTYELLPQSKGMLLGNTQAQYGTDTACVLLTIVVVPLSLKIFSRLLTRHKSLGLEQRMARYRTLWNIRLLCFAVVTVFDLWVYYATVNNIGGFCALICVIASLLFVPTYRRVEAELEAGNNIND
jgi:hypothetical protein